MLIYYTDINECLIDKGGCEFSCTNLEGINSTTGLGYQCGCDDGYQVAASNHDCNGMCVRIYVRKQSLRAQSTSARTVHIYNYSS